MFPDCSLGKQRDNFLAANCVNHKATERNKSANAHKHAGLNEKGGIRVNKLWKDCSEKYNGFGIACSNKCSLQVHLS